MFIHPEQGLCFAPPVQELTGEDSYPLKDFPGIISNPTLITLARKRCRSDTENFFNALLSNDEVRGEDFTAEILPSKFSAIPMYWNVLELQNG